MALRRIFTITDTSPAAASTAAGTILRGLTPFDVFTIDAALVGATGGTLDIYLQRSVGEPGSDVWRDWLHYSQLAAAATAVKYVHMTGIGGPGLPTLGETAVGEGSSPVLASGAFIGGHPGEAVRALYVAGASTSAGAAVSIIITAWRHHI